MYNQQEIHVVGCNVWSDYSSDVIFDDGTALCFGTGLDSFVRAGRVTGASGAHQRLAIDLQHHYTSHALSKDLPHVGAALKVISTISPRGKFLRTAVNAITKQQRNRNNNNTYDEDDNSPSSNNSSENGEGIMFWKSQTVSIEEYVAPPKDDKKNIIINPEDNSVTVIAIGGNASLRLSSNGAFFDITWPCRAFESDGRSIQFIASEHNQPKINDRGINTVKAVICVPHQQRFPVGLAVDSFRKFPKAPEYRHESVTNTDFWAPLACWAPLLRVALRVWKEKLGGVCPESVNQFLEVTSDDAAMLKSSNPKAAAIMNSNFSCEERVSSNFPAPIPPKVCAVVAPFPKLSIEDAATLLASTSDRLHSLPIHDRLHSGASLCISWSSGDRCSWMSAEPGFARSLIFEDMSCLHIEGTNNNHNSMALLHIQNAIKVSNSADESNADIAMDSNNSSISSQQDENRELLTKNLNHHIPAENERTSIVAAAATTTNIESSSSSPRDLETTSRTSDTQNDNTNNNNTHHQQENGCYPKLSAAARVYSWATGSLEATSRHAPMLPSIVVIPARHLTCAATTPPFPLFTARVGSSDVDPRKGRYLHAEVEFIASFLQVGKQTKRRAACGSDYEHSNNTYNYNQNNSTYNLDTSRMMNSSTTTNHDALNRSTTAFGNPSSTSFEGIGAVRCSSTIPNVGIFTSYQDGTCRCCFDDRTILTLKIESVNPTNERLHSRFLSIEEIFVTALDNRAVSTRFRASSCNPQHPMYNYLQYALPFMRYSSLPPEERQQLCQDPITMTTCASDFDGKGDMFHGDSSFTGEGGANPNPVSLATQLERVIARSQLTLLKHTESSQKRQQMLDDY